MDFKNKQLFKKNTYELDYLLEQYILIYLSTYKHLVKEQSYCRVNQWISLFFRADEWNSDSSEESNSSTERLKPVRRQPILKYDLLFISSKLKV